MKHYVILLIAISLFSVSGFAQGGKPVRVEFQTTKGKFTIELSDTTPAHRDNFIKQVSAGVYDGLLFHRVVDQFVIQTGNVRSRTAEKGADLSEDSTFCTLPAEIHYPELFHRRGAVAAARAGDDSNPEKDSSCTQFYIVTGQYFTPFDLKRMQEETAGEEMPQEVRTAYLKNGGTPSLDGKYTVFGYIVEGQKTVEKINRARGDMRNRPWKDIRIKSAKIVEQP